jgi:hypothetical protein
MINLLSAIETSTGRQAALFSARVHVAADAVAGCYHLQLKGRHPKRGKQEGLSKVVRQKTELITIMSFILSSANKCFAARSV